MAEEAQTRIQNALSKFVDEIDKSHLRGMQRSMHLCSADCCTDSTSSMESVHQCVENCTRRLSQSQNYVQNELGQFQERLQRGILLCQDRIKEKVGPNPNEAELKHYKNEFESCAVQCVDYHINQLPSLMQKITKNLEH